MNGATQFWIGLGVPSFLILLGMWRNDKRFDALESRLLVIEADLRRFYQDLGRHDDAIVPPAPVATAKPEPPKVATRK